MNEPVAVEPQPARANDSASTPAGFGYTLAQARVRAGLSVEQAAARIRLHPKQLKAIENEDLQLLPTAAYVNGFVRNYARELGIDARPLVEDLNAKLKLRGLDAHAPDLGPGGAVHAPTLDDRGWRHLVLAVIVIALICAGLIGVWMARSSSARHGDAATTRTSGRNSTPAGTPGAAAGATAGSPAAAEAPGNAGGPVQSVATPAPGAGVGAAGTPAPSPGAAPASSSPSPAVSPGAASSAPPASPGDADSKGTGAAGRVPVATLTPAAAATTGLVLRFKDRSWVEVS
ncbi:MAG TPA: helix-turn-helix domain-containing protein, partial [Burkholderiaceae bacterium]|nr:helix-turn-helix domain-containing protein [Burkholderiaceae bacterium]